MITARFPKCSLSSVWQPEKKEWNSWNLLAEAHKSLGCLNQPPQGYKIHGELQWRNEIHIPSLKPEMPRSNLLEIIWPWRRSYVLSARVTTGRQDLPEQRKKSKKIFLPKLFLGHRLNFFQCHKCLFWVDKRFSFTHILNKSSKGWVIFPAPRDGTGMQKTQNCSVPPARPRHRYEWKYL